jgi:DNA polymerase III alpha subunit (gram-positive type)
MEELLVFADFEATGLSVNDDDIVQVCVSCPALNKKLSYYCKPSVKMTEGASKVTKITDEFLKDKETFKSQIPKLIEFFSSLVSEKEEKKIILGAHNGFSYDFPLLFSNLIRSSYNIGKFLDECKITKFFDSLQWCRSYLPREKLLINSQGNPSFKLSDIHKCLVGCDIKNAHDADADTVALCSISKECKWDSVDCKLDARTVDEFLKLYTEKRKALEDTEKRNRKRKIEKGPTITRFLKMSKK